MDPVCWRIYEGSCLIIPHGSQYRTLFLEIVVPRNHWGPLIDHNTGEPYPMVATGDFCLVDPIFPGSPGDSLLFKEDDLAQLKRKGFHIPTYREEKPQPTGPRKTSTSLPMPRRMHQAPPAERKNHARPAAGTPGLHHPGHLTPQAARSHLSGENAEELKNNGLPPPSTRIGPTVTKTANTALTRRAAVLPASVLCHHLHALALGNTHGRNLVLMNPPVSPVRVHMPTTGACLGV